MRIILLGTTEGGDIIRHKFTLKKGVLKTYINKNKGYKLTAMYSSFGVMDMFNTSMAQFIAREIKRLLELGFIIEVE
jgi:hypothetical protein